MDLLLQFSIITPWVDIGDAGRQSDCGVFAASNIGRALDEGLLNIPPPRRLYGNTKLSPFVLVGDEAFPLKEYLIKPYARASIKEKKEVANYRILFPYFGIRKIWLWKKNFKMDQCLT